MKCHPIILCVIIDFITPNKFLHASEISVIVNSPSPDGKVETGSRELKYMIKIGLYSIIDFFIEKSGQRSMNIYIYSLLKNKV